MSLEAQNNPFTSVLMVEAADPEAIGDADPGAGQRRLVVGTDHLLYLVSDAGVKTLVGGAGIANPLATDSLWDAAGDLVQGSGANTAAKLSAGTAGKVLTSNGAAAALTWETPAGGGAVATDAIWDTAGDLAVGTGANTAAKLVIGAAGGHVSRINGAVAWDSGTSFPSAATGDRYYRTDVQGGMECIYDGTRWLSAQIFQIEMKREDSGFTWPATAATIPMHRGTLPFGGTYDYWLIDYRPQVSVATTNNGTNYWTINLYKYNSAGGGGTVIATGTTAADTAGTEYLKVYTIGALLGSYVGFYNEAGKTLSPGAIKLHGGHVNCRAVIT